MITPSKLEVKPAPGTTLNSGILSRVDEKIQIMQKKTVPGSLKAVGHVL